MHEGIRDTSAQDVLLDKTRRWRWLKWAVPVAVLALLGLLLGSVLTTWLSAEASVSTDRIRTAVVSRGDLIRDLNVQGRVVAAVGSSGAGIRPKGVSVDFCGLRVFVDGAPVVFDLHEMGRRMAARELSLDVHLGSGAASWIFWTCDFSYDYVRINADYHT